MDAHERSQLVVEWNGHQLTVDAAADSKICLGATDGCDVQVARPFSSRDHACIKHDQGYFVLVDRSTNGTFYISLGEPLCQESAIRFQHT